MPYVKYYYDPSEPNGAYDENTLAGCVNGGEGYEKVDSSSSASSARKETIYFCIEGVPSGATITKIQVDYQCKHVTWQNAGGLLYKTDLKWKPVLLQNYALSGSKITSLGTVTDLAGLSSIYSKTGTFTSWTSKSHNASFSKAVSGNNLVGVAFEIGSYNTLGDIHFWFRNVNITVTYTVPTYTVTWKNHDGTVLETDTGVASGTTPTYNGATPTKTATAQYTYTFSGWSPSVGAISGNTTYTAQFTATLRKYTVTWKNYDGSVLETDTNVPYGTTPTYNGATPARATDVQYTYAFKGWDKTVSAVTGNATYTAQFTATVRKYTVSSAVSPSDGGTVTGAGTYEYGKTVTLTATPKTGYKFVKWNDGVTTASRAVTVTGNATYTAYFELDKINNIYINEVKPKSVYFDQSNIVFVVDGTIPSLSGSIWDTVDGFHIKVQNTVPSGMTEAKQIYVDLKKFYG